MVFLTPGQLDSLEFPAMSRPRTNTEALSPGQLARRWGISPDRVQRLIDAGQLPGAFRIPSSGKYGKAIRIPLWTVLTREEKWAMSGVDRRPSRPKPPRPRGGSPPALRHFPELASNLEHGAESPEDGRH